MADDVRDKGTGPEDLRTDILDDAIALLGTDAGQGGLAKPADIIAQEEAAVRAAAKAEAEQPAQGTEKKDEGEQSVTVQGIDIEILKAKLEKGEELTEDEKKALQVIETEVEKPEKPAKPTKTYTIAGKTVSFEEMEKRWREETKIGGVDVSAEALELNVDRFVRGENREAAQVALAERQKQVAVEVKEAEARKQELTLIQQRLDLERSRIQMEKSRIAKMKQRLIEKANAPVTKQDLEPADPTERVDPDKQFQYSEKLRAQAQLQEVEEQEAEMVQMERNINAQRLYTELTQLQLAHSQYQTKEDIRVLAKKHSEGQALPAEDEIKFLALTTMGNEAITHGLRLDQVYALRKAEGRTLPEAAAQTPQRPALGTEKKPETLAAKIEEYKRRLAKNPKLAGGSGGGQRGTAEKSPARKMIEGDRFLMDEDPGDFGRKGWFESPRR